MKILQVVQFFSPNHGGSATVPYELSKQLQDNNEVTIVTTDYQINDGFTKNLPKANIKIFHCKLNLFGLLISPTLKEYVKNNISQFDIIHMHNYRTYQNVIVYKYAKKNNIPYIVQAHGSVMPFYQRILFKKIFDIAVGNKILQDASKVIAVTRLESGQYKTMGVKASKIEIIPNGITIPNYMPPKGSFKKKYNINDNQLIILYIGRIHKIKGISLLIDAFSKLADRLDNVILVIAGPDDGYLPKLKKQINNLKLNNKILITGALYGDDKFSAYNDADIYVLPSVYETFPITVLEAWSCNTPVIVTDRCGISDEIKDKAGLVVSYNVNQLLNAMYKLLTNDKLRDYFGNEGKKLVLEKYLLQDNIKTLEKLYISLINK